MRRPLRLLAGLLPVAALFAAPTQPASRAYGPWHSMALGGGGYILAAQFAPSDPNVFYANIDVGGIYRSGDGGKSWRMLHGALPPEPGITETASLSIDPRDADIVLAAVGSQWFAPHGVYRTTDGGRTWKKSLAGHFYGNHPFRADGQVLARSPKNPDVVAAGSSGDGLFLSADGGRTWKKRGLENLNITHVQFDPAKPGRLWACALPWKSSTPAITRAGGFYRSDDLGRTWTKLADDGPSELAVRADGREMLGIFIHHELRLSRDGGETWEPFNKGLPYGPPEQPTWHDTNDRTNAIAAGPGFWLTASRVGNFFRRDFDAETWTPVLREGLTETEGGRPWWGRATLPQRRHFGSALSSIWINPRDARDWIFSDWYGLYRTRDAGRHWTLTLDGIEPTCLHALTPDPAVPGRVHLGYWDLGYVVSDDAGTSAHRDRSGQVTANFKAIVVSPRNPKRLYATGDGRTVGWEATTLWRSDDGGDSWQKLETAGLAPLDRKARFNSLATDPRDPDVAWVAASGPVGDGRGGPYVTRDGGRTWTWAGEGLPREAPFFRADIAHHGPELAIDQKGAIVAVSVDFGGVYRRGPDDREWHSTVAPGTSLPRAVAAEARRPGRFYMSDTGGVSRSDDAGQTWTRVYRGDAGKVATDPRQADRVAVGTQRGVAVSLDAGRTWTELGEGLPHRWYPVPAFSGNRLLVGTIGSGVFWRELPAGEAGSAR